MLSTDEIRTKDGKKIGTSSFIPDRPNGDLIIIAATGGSTKKCYSPFAVYLQDQGYVVITFDYRGMGASAPLHLKGYEASMHQWAVQDIDAVILFAKKKFPNYSIIYLGHGIGGEIIGLAQASQYISKLILINSALSCKKLWPLKNRLKISGLKIIMRITGRVFGFFPAKYGGYRENIPKGVMHQWANWCSHSNGLFDIFPDNNYRKLQVPLLSISIADDWRCPPSAVRELLSRFSAASITSRRLKPVHIGKKKIGHNGFFDPAMKNSLWKMLLDWLSQKGFVEAEDSSGQPLND